jgi:hypothetical protein
MNKPLLVLALTTALFGTASAYLWKEVRTQREQVQALEAQVQSLRSNRPAATFDNGASNAPIAEPTSAQPIEATAQKSFRQRLVAFNSRAEVNEPAEPDQDKIQEHFARQQQALMKDPEYLAALRSQQRIMLARQFPYLAEDLGLSPEVTDRLLDLLTEQQIEQMKDSQFDPSQRRDPAAMAELQRKFEERNRANQAALAQVLGPDGMQRWQDYQSTMGSRFRARQLSQALDAAGMPLNDDQKRSLRHALADHERQMQQEAQNYAAKMSQAGPLSAQDRIKMAEEQLERTESYYERARTAVAGILSSEQLDQYKTIHEQELAMRRAQLRVQRAQLDANGGEDPTEMGFFSGTVGTAMPVIADED